ncbi:MAG: S9 family peptidase [Terriglobales bacterium]
MSKRILPLLGFALAAVAVAAFAQSARRPLRVNDLNAIRSVRDPQCSPGGHWVAYVVSSINVKKDKHESHIWMANVDGSQNLQLTDSATSSESSPQWSPNGKYLAFTSGRPGPAAGGQVWLLNRQGGEAVQLTAVVGALHGFVWSPDSQKLALVIEDPSAATLYKRAHHGKAQPPQPVVIKHYLFEADTVGYLTGRKTHIYIFDIATKKLTRLTDRRYDQSQPAWAPDSRRIAFFSNHDPHPDREYTGQLYEMDVRPGAVAKQLTPEDFYAGGQPAWSPDGRWIAFSKGTAPKVHMYSMARLAVVASDGSSGPRLVAPQFDRAVASPHFTPDGNGIIVTVTDDRSQYPARFSVADGSETKLLAPPIVASGFTSKGGCEAAVVGYPDKASEVYAIANGAVRQLSHQNDKLFAQLQLGKVRGVEFTASDGNSAHGVLTLPVDYHTATRVPFLLRIHGGPTAQNDYSFSFENQIFASHGYAVLNVNYRGSNGRGQAYAQAISGDWGNLEEKDLEAGVNWAIKAGIADPQKLGVGGWSYGCISTDYMIASDPRFKAATCGAGTGFTFSLYGVDEYIRQYNDEIGPPWNPTAWATYQKIGYPLLHANRIKTATLYLSGLLDMNVPKVGNKQMYEALKTLNIPTELVLYPGQWHGFRRPSFQRDVDRRYLAWYAKYLLGKVADPAAAR